jgi:hypothetical protein
MPQAFHLPGNQNLAIPDEVNWSASPMSSPFEPDIPALWARCAARRVPRSPRAVRAATRTPGRPFTGRDPTWDALVADLPGFSTRPNSTASEEVV